MFTQYINSIQYFIQNEDGFADLDNILIFGGGITGVYALAEFAKPIMDVFRIAAENMGPPK